MTNYYFSDRPRKRRKEKPCLEEVFKNLNRSYVKIKKKERKRNNTILYSVLRQLLDIMQKHNKLFCSLKPKLEYLGSYFDGLRVGQPTEYDINIFLKLPVDYKKIFLDASAAEMAYDCTNIVMPSEFRRLSKTPATANKGFYDTKMWCDKHFRLSVKKFHSWMQRVLDMAMATLPLVNNRRLLCVNNKPFLITSKTSGPACTITILAGNNEQNVIDVDLVPTFAFELPKKPFRTRVLFEYLESNKMSKNKYFVVPKPSDDEFSWRLAFPFQERDIIKNKNYLKSTAKLLKLLRDAQDFKQLASYYIKTLFLWENKNQKDEFWKHNSLSFLVIHMLTVLKNCLAIGEIKNFWCPEVNLLKGKIRTVTCQNWSNRLAVILRDIEQKGKDNPYIVAAYFKKKNAT